MSPNRRIFLNIVATYGRSLYALVIGLFTARWVLMSLGQVDYGLVGVVGGLIAFVAFFNSIMAGAVGRFYAFAVGRAKVASSEAIGIEDCRRWFSIAVAIHTILPLILMIIGYPLGVWAVQHFLTIPPDRVQSCVWVWRFSCLACFVGMVNVPFAAMYNAKQEIAELTIYGFASTTLNAVFLYYMVSHPGVWIVIYSLWCSMLSVIPQLIITTRAFFKYPECRFVPAYAFDGGRIWELLKFVAAKFWADFSSMFSSQGQAILVNKYMGPAFNTAMTVGLSVVSHTETLAGSITGAFAPAITNLCGEGRMDEMRRFAFMVCRLNPIFMLVFAIPVALEAQELLDLWLVKPPEFAAVYCVTILCRDVLERMTIGHSLAIYGRGYKVPLYAWTGGWAGISTVFVSWLCFSLGFSMWSIVIGLSVSKVITVLIRLIMGRPLVGMDTGYWFGHVCVPIAVLTVTTVAAGFVPRVLMSASFLRVVVTTISCELVFLPFVWFVVLEKQERTYLTRKLRMLYSRLFQNGIHFPVRAGGETGES